ncbi:MAG: FHA domain-containing protein, partial [Chloroflexi bacterium]|nr:FHA domain-containing protein [Chloroflexota bacterium]
MGGGRREWLLVKAAEGSEARFEIGPAALGIGRDPASRVVLRDSYVSAAHAEIVEHGGERCVRDLGSRNGTRLNGRALAPRTLQALQDGDVLRIGPSELTYRCAPTPDGVAGHPAAPASDEVPTRRGARPRREREPASA